MKKQYIVKLSYPDEKHENIYYLVEDMFEYVTGIRHAQSNSYESASKYFSKEEAETCLQTYLTHRRSLGETKSPVCSIIEECSMYI